MLNHHRQGSGPPLLLLHGIGMQWQWWQPCLDGLAAHHDVVALDFPGFGGSAPFDGTPSFDGLADSALELAGDLGLERPHVAGISMGGQVALELARRDAVASSTAISPGGLFRGWERSWARGSLALTLAMTRFIAPRAEAFVSRPRARLALFGQAVAHGDRIPPAAAAGFLRAFAESDFERTLDALVDTLFEDPFDAAMPVTVAWGTRDFLLFPWQADRAVEIVRGARKVKLPGASHVPTYDDPDATIAAILQTTGARSR